MRAGDFLLNLSINVASVDLIAWCRDAGVLYLDACIEPWEGGYYDTTMSASQRSNYGLREEALALRRPGSAPTAVLTHGVNPGLASHFVKQALLDVAAVDRQWPTGAGRSGRLGVARAPAGHQDDPHRRAGHPGGGAVQAARRIRQHLVGGGIRR